jgi:hypothetical protein
MPPVSMPGTAGGAFWANGVATAVARKTKKSTRRMRLITAVSYGKADGPPLWQRM